MKKYKGIIFNSVNVGLLNGELGKAVAKHGIRTGVVSRKTRSEVKKLLKSYGVRVDVTVGSNDLNTRYKQYVKPLPDPLLVATAMMYLEPEEVVIFGDYKLDRQSAIASGLDYCKDLDELLLNLDDVETINPESPCPPVMKDIQSVGIMGAIVGDIIGSAYEFHPTDNYNFEPFVKNTHVTDDSVATLAVAKWLLGDRVRESLVRCFRGVCNRHPNAGYGSNFKKWLRSKDAGAYKGTTNGAMMRASACGWAAESLEEAMDLGKRSAEVSHDSEEGICGAQAVASAIFLLRSGYSKEYVKDYVQGTFSFNLDMSVTEHRSLRSQDHSCHVTGAQAFRCWLEADSFEDCIRNAVTLRTDADTVADIAGALCAATPGMGIPKLWAEKAFEMLDDELKQILLQFIEYLG